MIRRLVPCLILTLAVAGCSGVRTVADGLGDAATAPLEDVGVKRERIPTVLLQAQANPYDMRNLDRCSTIGAEIARLDEALGPDLDEPPAPDGRTLGDQAVDAAAEAALDVIRDTATDFIPARSWVRALSGADRHSREVQAAIEAGRLRRAFLKGQGMRFNCAPPAAPRWFQPRRR